MSDNAVRQIVLASRPKGMPTTEKFRVEEMSKSASRAGLGSFSYAVAVADREAQTRPLSDPNSVRSRSASRQGAK